MDGELRQLMQQMGDVAASLRTLHETLEVRQTLAEQGQESLRLDLRILRQEQRDLEERLHCVTFVVQRDVTALRCGSAENQRSIETLTETVETLRRPITEIVLLKSRIAGLIVGLGFIGSIVLWLAEPVYRWLIDTKILRAFGGS